MHLRCFHDLLLVLIRLLNGRAITPVARQLSVWTWNFRYGCFEHFIVCITCGYVKRAFHKNLVWNYFRQPLKSKVFHNANNKTKQNTVLNNASRFWIVNCSLSKQLPQFTRSTARHNTSNLGDDVVTCKSTFEQLFNPKKFGCAKHKRRFWERMSLL